jgi:LCP family protein required for cell wall assembly
LSPDDVPDETPPTPPETTSGSAAPEAEEAAGADAVGTESAGADTPGDAVARDDSEASPTGETAPVDPPTESMPASEAAAEAPTGSTEEGAAASEAVASEIPASEAEAPATETAEAEAETAASETAETETPATETLNQDGANEGGKPSESGEKRLVASSTRVVPAEAAAETLSPGQVKDRKEVRKARKKEKRRKHRWRRRIIYALSLIVFLGAAGVGGIVLYARYRYDEIPKIHSKHLVKQTAVPGKPFNVLLVGDDSRAFVNNATQIKAFGDESTAGGQRSDVTMVARFVPATKSVTVISIPRDLWVNIPPNNSDIQGMNRINAADNAGPDLLIQTIETDLGIPINHYISVGFPGFLGMVDALGGVTMDFPTAVKDAYTGLDVTTVGCQVINGTTSLQLVRARHLEYMNSNGHWEYDGLSDFSRIQRQDSFFRAVLAKVNTSITNPLAVNGFISSAVGNLAIDDTLSETNLLHIATEFRGLQSSHLVTETLPTTAYVTGGGADVLLAAQPYASQMIAAFNQLGAPPPNPASTTTTTTTAPPLANSAVSVDVLNASGGGLLAGNTAENLRKNGFEITGIDDAPSVIATGNPSEIFYGPTGLPAAKTLAASLQGKVAYVPDPTLTGNRVTLWVANSTLTVTSPTTTTTTTTTAPPVPGAPTTTTTIPGNVYTNTQMEPWNPVPCTLGAPATTTTPTTPKKTTPPTKQAAKVKPAAKTASG